MEKDKEITWSFPELRIGLEKIANNLKIDNNQLLRLNNMRAVNILSSHIGLLLYKRLYTSSFRFPNINAIDFELKDYHKIDYIGLDEYNQVAVVRLMLNYSLFINLSEVDKRLYVLDKIIYAYQKLAELVGVDINELKKVDINIRETKFKVFITNEAKTSRNRAYRAEKMYNPYCGYRDWYIWVKHLKTNKIEEIFLFQEVNHPIGGKMDYISTLEALEILNNSEKVHGWNKKNEFQISWGDTHYFYNPETGILRVETIKN